MYLKLINDFQTVEHMESDMTAEEVHSELVKENILPLKIETHEDAVKAASAEVIEALTIGVAQEAGEDRTDLWTLTIIRWTFGCNCILMMQNDKKIMIV